MNNPGVTLVCLGHISDQHDGLYTIAKYSKQWAS